MSNSTYLCILCILINDGNVLRVSCIRTEDRLLGPVVGSVGVRHRAAYAAESAAKARTCTWSNSATFIILAADT